MFLAIFFTTSYVRRVFWETTICFIALILNNSHFFGILGHFEPFWAISRYPEFLKFCPMHYFISSDFQSSAFRHKHCFECIFQKFLLRNSEFWAKLGVFGGFWGANFYWYNFFARNHLKHVYRVKLHPCAKIWMHFSKVFTPK